MPMLLANTAVHEAAQAIERRVASDPAWFAEQILGHDLWGVQRAILRAIARPWARVAIKACHASSKTFTAAEIVLWAPLAGGIAVTTAPTSRQVRRLVWTEVQAMYPKARFPLGGELLDVEFRVGPAEYALGLSTDQGVNFQGFHARPGKFLLLVMDEAPGVNADVYPAIEGIRAGGDVRVLVCGNPDVASGPFYDIFEKERSGWETFTIDAFATPNLEDETQPGRYLTPEALLDLPEERLAYNPRPYLITRRFIREKWSEWGEDNPLWESKIRGRFPKQAQDALLSLTWLEAAQARKLAPQPSDAWEAGVDVAGPGEDETVLCVRQGATIRHLESWAQSDPRGEVLASLQPYASRLASVKVDTVGIGYYFARHLEDHGFSGKVVDVNVGEAADDPEKYANLKASAYWGLRQRAQDGDFAGLTDQTALAQLASLRYRQTPRGQVQIESKEEARKRGVRSPDRAEAIMLAFLPRATQWVF